MSLHPGLAPLAPGLAPLAPGLAPLAPGLAPLAPGIPGARGAFLRLAVWGSEAQADDRLPGNSQSV